MINLLRGALALILSLLLAACGQSVQPFPEPTAAREVTAMNIQIGEHTFTATLADTRAAAALREKLEEGPLTLSLSDYSGFEKVGALGFSLPADDHQLTTVPGDVVLYTGRQIVMFYGSNHWDYTLLGHVDDLTGWEDALGSGDVTVTLSLPD